MRYSWYKTILLLLVVISASMNGCATDGFYGMPEPGRVGGVLTYHDGRPVEGGVVYFYKDDQRRFRGPADYMAEPAGADGSYMTELPPGKYWAVGRKRLSGSIAGNIEKGDFQSREAYGPFVVRPGERVRADLTLEEMTGNMLFSAFAVKGALQGITGVIRDRSGKPFQRAYAFAYKDPHMVGKPDYVSEWTREDGKFVIYIMEPGTYYVGARTGYMGVPRPDEPYGRYEGSHDHSVVVVEGSFVKGIDVVLKRFSAVD
jgi:hypothetical protein